MTSHQNFINGNFCGQSKGLCSINPSTEQAIASFPMSDESDVQMAVISARKAFKSWSAKSRVKRAEYFDTLCQIVKNRQHEIAELISTETGKTLNESHAEVVESLHMAQYCFGKGRDQNGEIVPSELSERDLQVIRKPKGVVAVISPWNFPLAIGGFWCAAPAILEGNTVVLKPSENSPCIGNCIAKLYKEAGFPQGVINVIHGDGYVGQLLVESNIDHVCFTGSADTGMKIRKKCTESWHKTCSCEMGSKSAVMVFEDGQFDLAIDAAINSAFKLSGQRCVSSGRILIEKPIYKKFCDAFIERSAKLKTGSPFEDDVNYGPIISQRQMERVLRFNDLASENVALKGSRIDRKGYFLSPHVYRCEWSDKPYLKQEVFGPHCALVPFSSLDEAIEIYNDTDFGLALGAVTDDFRKMREIRQRCDAGMIYFNLGSIGAESSTPFTGIKKSGSGWGSAVGTFDAVVHKISITTNYSKTLNFPQGLK